MNLKSLSHYELDSSIPQADVLLSDEQGKDLKKPVIYEQMDEETQAVVRRFLDLAIRDFQALKAYAS